jgi:hypothetical protein
MGDVSDVPPDPTVAQKSEYNNENHVYQDVESVNTESLDDVERLKRAEAAKVR